MWGCGQQQRQALRVGVLAHREPRVGVGRDAAIRKSRGGGWGARLADEWEVGRPARSDHVMSQPGSGRGRAR